MKAMLAISIGVLFPLASFLAAQEEKEDYFWKTFAPSYRAKNEESMQAAVKADPKGAINSFMRLVDEFGEKLEDKTGDKADAIRVAWNASMNNELLENLNSYLQLLDPQRRARRRKQIETWGKIQILVDRTLGTRSDENWRSLEQSLPNLCESMEALGDIYHAAEARYALAQTWDPNFRPKDANGRKALVFYRQVMDHRDRLGYQDELYTKAKTAVEDLEKVYADQPAGTDADAVGSAIPYKDGSSWQDFELVSETLKPGAFQRFGYDYDGVYATWQMLSFQNDKNVEGMGSGTLPGLEPKVGIIREASARYFVDQDNDGKGDIRLKVSSGKSQIIEVPRDFGTFQDTYAVEITSGSDRENVQGVQTNVAPTDDQAMLYWRSQSSKVGTILDQPFRFFDENSDGFYDYNIVARPEVGLTKVLSTLDGWIIGKGKRVAPASAYTKIGEEWYRVEFGSKRRGRDIKIRAVTCNPGTLVLDWKGPGKIKPSFLIMRAIGIYNGGHFDIAANKKGVEVPPGGYQILYGVTRFGKGKQAQKLVILPGSFEKVIVESGQTTKVSLGSPFSFDFSYERGGGQVTVPGKSVMVTGKSGEQYAMIWTEKVVPEAQARILGGKPLGKAVASRNAELSDLERTGDWSVLWHPMDMLIPLPKTAGEIQVRLTQKKHKWFGKIQSAWK